MSKLTGGIAAFAVVVLYGSSTAAAANLSIPIDTAISAGLAVGERTELVTVATADLAGSTCDVRSVRRDQSTSNRGNDLIVTSGQGSTTLTDVEREPAAVTEGEAIMLGETVTVVLEMGPDEAFAGGIDVEFDCPDAAPVEAGDGGATPTDTPTAVAEPGQIPETGAETTVAALLGGLFVVSGAALRRLARRPIGV